MCLCVCVCLEITFKRNSLWPCPGNQGVGLATQTSRVRLPTVPVSSNNLRSHVANSWMSEYKYSIAIGKMGIKFVLQSRSQWVRTFHMDFAGKDGVLSVLGGVIPKWYLPFWSYDSVAHTRAAVNWPVFYCASLCYNLSVRLSVTSRYSTNIVPKRLNVRSHKQRPHNSKVFYSSFLVPKILVKFQMESPHRGRQIPVG